jgi:hypothetical protein
MMISEKRNKAAYQNFDYMSAGWRFVKNVEFFYFNNNT